MLNSVTLRKNISFLGSLKENWLPPNYCWWLNSSRKEAQHIFLSDNEIFQQKSQKVNKSQILNFLLKHLRHLISSLTWTDRTLLRMELNTFSSVIMDFFQKSQKSEQTANFELFIKAFASPQTGVQYQ